MTPNVSTSLNFFQPQTGIGVSVEKNKLNLKLPLTPSGKVEAGVEMGLCRK